MRSRLCDAIHEILNTLYSGVFTYSILPLFILWLWSFVTTWFGVCLLNRHLDNLAGAKTMRPRKATFLDPIGMLLLSMSAVLRYRISNFAPIILRGIFARIHRTCHLIT